MNEPEFNPQEQDIIQRLANAPQPSLNPAAFELIRARMLDAVDVPPPDLIPRLSPRPFSLPLLAGLAAVIIVVVGVVVLFNPPPTVTLTTVPPASLPVETTQPPTASPAAQVVVTAEVSPTPPPTQLPPAIATAVPTIPAAVPTATLEPLMIVEGPVESIEGNVITIYGTPIVLDADDPLLTVIVVGDVLRVEADYAEETTVIVAVTVEPVTNDVNVNPDTGEAWRDDGSCNNPPPDWAPANGWRRRCQGADPPGNGSGNGQGSGNGNGGGNGNGRGNNDDDDD